MMYYFADSTRCLSRNNSPCQKNAVEESVPQVKANFPTSCFLAKLSAKEKPCAMQRKIHKKKVHQKNVWTMQLGTTPPRPTQ